VLAVGLATHTEAPDAEAGPGGTQVVPPKREPPPPLDEIARQFPQLEILECLGRGGMGVVYKARQPLLNRFVALKILAREKEKDPRFAERFTREAQALARLNHPNIVTVYDFGETNGLYYLLMEFVDGMSLRQLLETRKLAPEEALAIVPAICDALQYAHQLGIVHRDIKPENILLDKQGRVKIADYGIAKLLGAEGKVESLTGEQQVVGTPHYMAPEQVEKPSIVDHRADIFSLGVVFYEMLTGELPLGKFAPPSRVMKMDVRLDEVVLHALEKEPERRYQHASQVKADVETIARTEGLGPKSEAPDSALAADALAQQVLARDYVLDIGSCLRRGWALVRSDFWPLVGVTALVLVLLSAASSLGEVSHSAGNVTVSASVLAILLGGPLMGGLYLHFLKKIRGERVRLETAFSGFSNSLLHLVLAGFVIFVLTLLGFICLILPGVYLFVAWFFTLPLVIDKRLDFWPAMRVSRKVISRHWWEFLGFVLVLALVNLAGIMAACVGVFVTIPVSLAALMYAYEDIFNPPMLPSAPPAGSGVPGADSRTQPDVAAPLTPQPDRFWRRFAVVIACILLIPTAIAIIKARERARMIQQQISERDRAVAQQQMRQQSQPAEADEPSASGPEIQTFDEAVKRGSEASQSGDYSKAYALLLPAARKGNPIAQHRVGILYAFGLGVPQDFAAATGWFRKAAEQGQGESQFSMGMRYLLGQSVAQDDTEAARWFRLAAEQGVGMAASMLAELYAKGRGVPRDLVEAYQWLAVAGDQIEPNRVTVTLGDLENKLTPEQLAEAQRRVKEFVPKRKGPADP
jgi:hypothetical protein